MRSSSSASRQNERAEEAAGGMRFLIAPFREIVLAFRDARSREMKEVEDHRKLAELGRDGEGLYIAKRATALTMIVEGVLALKFGGDVLAGHLTRQQVFTDNSYR